jgi:hypothetical protein
MEFSFFLVLCIIQMYGIASHRQRKVKLLLYLITPYAVKTYGGVDVWMSGFLTSVLDGGEFATHKP